MVNRREIVLDYAPRKAFLPFHNRKQRWSCLVAHRRAGKTVAAVNEIIKQAALNTSGTGLYGYVAPYRSQAKSISWDYMKRYAKPLIKSANEAELQVDLINGSRIRLFGADNADAMRGLGFDGVYMDEYGDFKPSVWGNVIRPALSDKQGWAVFGGTPKGKNQFWEVLQTARMNPKEWFHLILKASESAILPETELDDNRRQLSKDQYEQEYECSFEAAILGAFYGVEMRMAADEKRIGKVDYDETLPTYTAWDLGYRDDTAIWWYQVLRNEIHVIDYHAVSGKGVKELAKIVTDKPYHYEKHFLPHDAKAKTLAAEGKSIIEQLGEHLGMQNMAIVPDLSLQDGIQAVRKTLPICWFDEKRCYEGIEALRQYEREYDEDKKAFRPTPKHNWCFTGDTQVLTRYGTHQIKDLPYSGEVLTSCGWKRYVNPRVTRTNAPLVEVRFAGGYSVKCTPDHLFKTVSGWKSAESLTPGMLIQSSLIPSLNISTAGSIVSGKVTAISNAVANTFTETFGGRLLGQSPMVATSTTAIQTGQTTDWKTWSAFRRKFTSAKRWQGNQSAHSTTKPARRRLNGTNRTPDGCGTNATLNVSRLGQNGSVSPRVALSAVWNSWRSSVNQATANFIARLPAKLRLTAPVGLIPPPRLVIESVKRLKEESDVWCMSVPGVEEFSLSNGALVHNCSHPADAMRMLAISWNKHQFSDKKAQNPHTLLVGAENSATLNDMWASQPRPRRQRI